MEIKLRSSIKPILLRHTLFTGSLLSGFGVSSLLISALFLPTHTLEKYGFAIVLLAFLLIGFGLIPYRKLARLEIKPNEIIINEETLYIIFNKQPTLLIPIAVIENISYLDSKLHYGFKFSLKKPALEKMTLLNHRFKIVKWHYHSQKNYQCDLFLPYFSHRSYNEIKDLVQR